MPKKVSRKNLVKRLDNIFSQYIRLRNANAQGIAECYTCGKTDHWKKLQCGHFMSRKHLSTRWCDTNVQPQSAADNLFGQGEQYKFALHLDGKYGEGTAEELQFKSRQIHKVSRVEYEEQISYYKNIVENLKEEKGIE